MGYFSELDIILRERGSLRFNAETLQDDNYYPEQEDFEQDEDYDSDYIQDDWVDTEY